MSSAFGPFLEYLARSVSGEILSDYTYKYYDLLWGASDKRLRKALADCGFKDSELSVSRAECHTRARERGFDVSEATLQHALLEWYVWRRINEGRYRTWKWIDKT